MKKNKTTVAPTTAQTVVLTEKKFLSVNIIMQSETSFNQKISYIFKM